MTIIKLSTLAAVGAALLSGCGPGEEEIGVSPVALTAPTGDKPGAEASAQYSRLAVPSEYVAAAKDVALAAGPALDARYAAAAAPTAAGLLPTAGINPLAAWYTGALGPGVQQHWIWHNAGTGVYKVGLSPSGATTAETCQYQVVRSWNTQQPAGGERQFHFVVQNIGKIACGINVLLQSQAAASSWVTGDVKPGGTQGWTWNNANPLTAAHFVDIAPTGATSTDTCEFEVIRSFYTQQPSGERQFNFYVKNVGSITCGGNVMLATNTNVNSSWATGTLTPGSSRAWFWNNANPRNRVYVPGVSPLGAAGTSTCQLEILPTSYREEMNADGTVQRRYSFGVQNVGSLSCSGTLLLNYLDPGTTNPLPVNLYPQQTSQWCWAASGEMVMNYLGGSVSQCDEANRRFGRSDCCNTPTPAACINGGWPEFDKYGYTYNTSGALSWSALKDQIDSQHAPFAFSWGWTGGGGHMMVVTGYKVIGGQNWVSINDPWAPNVGSQRDILYTDYVSGTGYIHWTDYYNVSKR